MPTTTVSRIDEASRATRPADAADRLALNILQSGPAAWHIEYELGEAKGLERALAERFIAQCYRRNFRAHVDAFMPRLLVLRDEVGAIRGALGLRGASGRLFVERYLDVPIESAIRAVAGETVERESIAEVGHFSGLVPGTMRHLIVLLAERLHREGVEWVVFTGTRALCNTFRRMHLFPIRVCAASPARLSPLERAAWGTYYDRDPSVYVGRVGTGMDVIFRRGAARGSVA
jgi:hypothetical protein